jgi:hypothetical protein
MVSDEKNKRRFTIKSSLIYTKPNQRTRARAPPISSRRRAMARW